MISLVQVRSNLKQLADDKGVSIREVSREIDYRFESVRQMYNDEIKQYPRELLNKLCEYFNCSIKDLLVLDDGADIKTFDFEEEQKG